MRNILLQNKCDVPECDNEFDITYNNEKYCNKHCPAGATDIVKRLCKYCDPYAKTNLVCAYCKTVQNKKEWSVVRFLRREIDTKFKYNSSKMLQGCSKKRPDVFFDLPTHCVIVEIDKNQHNTYSNVCEIARLNEIVNGIGGRSVTVIRFNPDKVFHRGKEVKNLPMRDRLGPLLETVRRALCEDVTAVPFFVRLINLFYDDHFNETFCPIQEENITSVVCV